MRRRRHRERVALALRQVGYEHRAFWRNPVAAFFTFFFPLLFMVIFNVIFGGTSGIGGGLAAGRLLHARGHRLRGDHRDLHEHRDDDHRALETGRPQADARHAAAAVGLSRGPHRSRVLLALLLVVIVSAFGTVFYWVHLPWDRMPALL